jgi:hypothetical protein
MKITAIPRAQTIYSLPASFFATSPIFDLADKVKEYYQFRTMPSAQELANTQSSQPSIFLGGRMVTVTGRIISIDQLQITNFVGTSTAVSVVTRHSTDDSDLVVDDLIRLVREDFELRPTEIFPRQYTSQLEFALENSLAKRLDFLEPVTKLITGYVRSYGFTACPDYEPSAISFFFDNSRMTNPLTLSGGFAIDRRAGVPYAENRFYSQAFLKTEHHVAALEELEKALQQN